MPAHGVSMSGRDSWLWVGFRISISRRLLRDPTLAGVACVVLDEFHERHLEGDLALALLRRLQRSRRPDLRLVVMSATLDATTVGDYLGVARVIRSEGRQYPLEIEYT